MVRARPKGRGKNREHDAPLAILASPPLLDERQTAEPRKASHLDEQHRLYLLRARPAWERGGVARDACYVCAMDNTDATSEPLPRLLTVGEIAQLLRVSRPTATDGQEKERSPASTSAARFVFQAGTRSDDGVRALGVEGMKSTAAKSTRLGAAG